MENDSFGNFTKSLPNHRLKQGGQNGPFFQNMANLKLGYSIHRFTLKLGASFILSDNLPIGENRLPLFDLGLIDNQIFGIEVQFRIN